MATFRSFAQELTAVGGATVPADAVTNVTVSATHRRRGLLSRMMATDLAAAKERGDVVATLIAAEYPIYGRYGFGPATWTTEWTVDVPRAGLDPRWSGPGGRRPDRPGGRRGRTQARPRAARAAARLRSPARQPRRALVAAAHRRGRAPGPRDVDGAVLRVYRSADGEVDGLVVYGTDDTWGDAKQPLNTATVTG